MVVEDLPRVRSLLCELVEERDGFEVVAVADTEADAISQYETHLPHAVILDLALRQGSGLGVIGAVRRGVRPDRPLLIVLTNHALPLLEAACLRAGADHFLDKSKGSDFLKLRSLLDQARAARSG